MAHIATGDVDLKYDSLSIIPLGGQSELGQVLWVLSYGGEMILVDAGAAYPAQDLPGVDLLLPNTNFLEANKEKILALLLTNAHEEHCGAVTYLLHHMPLARIMGPRFVSAFLAQCTIGQHPQVGFPCAVVDTVEPRQVYQIGPFSVEWVRVNDAIADACALRIGTPEGTVIYTSSFKLDQTPVDNRLADVNRLALSGDDGVLVLISDSAGVESAGYTPSEKTVVANLAKHIASAPGRVIVVLPGTNTHRLQILFDIATKAGRKVVLLGETLMRTAVSAAITGNLAYDRSLEASIDELAKLSDRDVIVVATGLEGDPMNVMIELAEGTNSHLTVKEGDTVIYSAEVYPGRLRQMAMILDQFLSLGVKVVFGSKEGVHVSKHASREELKLMLSMIKPRYFIPAFGEGRHIMHHAGLAIDWGMPFESVFPLKNGEILSIDNGVAEVIGTLESQAVLFNRDQGERVTTFSVNERRSLSLEGVVSIGLVLNENGSLVSGPVIHAGASGFLRSAEWEAAKVDLRDAILETISRFTNPGSGGEEVAKYDVAALRAVVREMAVKTLRSRMQSKPTVQVILQELSTNRRL